jgi:hypothetical protein
MMLILLLVCVGRCCSVIQLAVACFIVMLA